MQGIIVVFLCTLIVFLVTEFSPGSAARKILGQFATEEQVSIFNERMGASKPAVERYFQWLGQIVGIVPTVSLDAGTTSQYIGNFGHSLLYNEPVVQLLWERLKSSMLLAGLALSITVPVSIALGMLCAVYHGSAFDNVVSTICIVSASLPQFVWGTLLVIVFVLGMNLLPGTSPMTQAANWTLSQQLILPVLTLVLVEVGYLAKIVRSSMITVLDQPYIRTARLKGASEFNVLFRHALPNGLVGPLTILMLQVGFLISGVVVTEVVFAYPGFGRMLLEAALYGDIALIQGATVVAVIITVSCQMLADIGYVVLNPRIKLA
ncbi:MAG: ABC transporter permease [Mesorhizobium sp.]|nr:ABC transporter permease [Mesorhizobium sp.]